MENRDTLMHNSNVIAKRQSSVKTYPPRGKKQDIEGGSTLPTVSKRVLKEFTRERKVWVGRLYREKGPVRCTVV